MHRNSLGIFLVCAALLGASACTTSSNTTDDGANSSSGHSNTETSSSSGMVASSGEGGSSSSSSSSGNAGSSGMGGSSGAGTSSSSGGQSSSEEGCTDECAMDTQVCDGTDGFRVCGEFDEDACLDLYSTRIPCPQGYVCTGGTCILPCTDECPAGTTACDASGQVVTCGNFDSDACRELGAPVACGTGNHCESGTCVPDSTGCSDECTAGQTVCFGDSTRACGNFDGDACLDLGAPVACQAGQTCTNGACVATCTNECPSMGATECSGNGTRTCGNNDADSCLEWGAVTACQSPLTCDQGMCVSTCSDECATPGAVVCSADNSGTRTCGNTDADACLDLSTAVPCGGGNTCMNGTCVPTCSDECTTGQTRCAGTGSAVESCGNYDADVCLEFGGAVACTGSATCSNGACNTPCTDDCAASAVECVAGQNGFRTCGQFDADACRDWSTVTACAAFEACSAGACALGPTPAEIVINELLYDATGTDTASGNTLMVELWGPPNESLDGWEIVGVNGSGGNDYNAIALTGEVIGTDGYFVIAHPNGNAALRGQADITSSSIDFQNGPDNVQLRWRGRVVDALGYGSFGSGDEFAGEGTAAPASGSGKSLTRNASHADTDDNSADFAVADPSPRANPVSCTNECTANQTQCSGTQIQSCGNFDADSCLEWGTAANCPNAGQQCVNGACSTPCTDECTANQTQCQGTQIQSCGNFDADSCLEWGTAANCANAGEQCSNGACSVPCNNECASAGVTSCSGAQVMTCGNYDGDSCLENSAPMNCPTGETCVMGSCQVANAPEVVLIAPQGTLQTTQGNTHRMLVDATAAPGRTITEVRYYANGVMVHATTTAPHEYTYTVPAAAQTGSTISLQARAVDNQNVVGSSAFASLNVRNDVPVATFNASISGANVLTVDASAVTDTETATSSLEVRWDWENDGTWDTQYSTTKVTTHDYGMTGAATYTVKMEVRDAVGQTASMTRTVTFQDIQFIGGTTLMTTTWYGTIIVTGDITVGSGQTLTIAEGTQVLFVRADTDNNGIGDYTLSVNGALIVNGTAANPVVFTGQNAAAKVRGGWDRIFINTSGSTINHAIIEYADVGIEAQAAVTLNNVTVRLTKWDGIELENADNSSLTDVTVTQTGQSGLYVHSGSTSVMVTGLTATQNVANGVWVDGGSSVSVFESEISGNAHRGAGINGATVSIYDSTVEINAMCGLCYYGNAGGTAQHNQVRQNGASGVELWSTNGGHPNPVVTENNIYSNATTGAARASSATTSSTLTAAHSGYNTTAVTSARYSAPAGAFIRRVRINYNETDNSSNHVVGTLLHGSDEIAFNTFNSDFSGWVTLPVGVTSLRVRVRDLGYSSTTDAIVGDQVELVVYDAAAELAAVTESGTPSLRVNYLGTFPNVLSRVSMNRTDALNLEGFVGVAFGEDWSAGPYKSGAQATQTWSGTVYVTGNVSVASADELTVAAGTRVLFVDHDQNNDGNGDFSLVADGKLTVAGTAASPVQFTGYGVPEGSVFQRIELRGGAQAVSTLLHAVVDHGLEPVVVRGPSKLIDVTVREGGQDGIRLENADNAELTRVVSERNVWQGVTLAGGTTGVTVSRLTSRLNGISGLLVSGASSAAVSDSIFRENALHGVNIINSSPDLDYNLVTYNNGGGIWVEGNSSPTGDRNVIKFNKDSGILVWQTGNGNPSPSFQYSNVYGNAVDGSTRTTTAATSSTLTASHSGYNNTTSSSPVYSAPAGHSIRQVHITYNETDNSSNHVQGSLVDADTDTTLTTFSSDFTGWVFVPTGTKRVQVRVRDNGYSSTTDTIVGGQVELQALVPTDHFELVAYTASGTTVAKFNYWTADVGDVPNKISQNRTGAVDYMGYTGFEYPSTGMNAVGPRP